MASSDPHGDRASVRDRRDDESDARDDAADRREQQDDIREGVLDRWERELAERAASLDMLDDAGEASRRLARQTRAAAHQSRRAAAEVRRAAATARGIDRAGHADTENVEPAAPGLDPQAAGRALDRLTELVESDGTLIDTLGAVLTIAVSAFAEAAAVTVTLTVDERLEPAASTAEWAGRLDTVQLRERVGPIVDAIDTRTVVTSTDLAADPRWNLGSSIGPDGKRAVLSAAIVVGGAASGALTVYAEPGRRFDRRSALTAALLATDASLAVGWSLDRLAQRAQTEAWERALASRDQIGQAKGILMEQHHLTADKAFELLRDTSQHHNSKVRDIAEHVVRRRRLPDSSSTRVPPESHARA